MYTKRLALVSRSSGNGRLTGERIRDKIAASKRKGIWMYGGLVPLGYTSVREAPAES